MWDLIRFFILLVMALLAVSCGKVGDPLPPVVRVPETAGDFQVVQVGYDLYFQWTNPSRNLDQSISTDLSQAILRAGAGILAHIDISAAGERQIYEMSGADLIGLDRDYTIQFETREGRLSDFSAPVRLSVIEVPGGGPIPEITIDQERAHVRWQVPTEASELVEGYRVYRSGELISSGLLETVSFDDRTFVDGDSYTYIVVAVRESNGRLVEGVPYIPLEVITIDTTPPAAPRNIEIVPIAGGAFIRWRGSSEIDIARYRIYRRTEDGDEFGVIDDGMQITTAFSDSDYMTGFAYAVSAIDQSGNESPMSEVVMEQ